MILKHFLVFKNALTNVNKGTHIVKCYLTPSTHHITPRLILKQLHWLPIKFCIDFKVLPLTYKALHNLVPPYLSVCPSPRCHFLPVSSFSSLSLSLKMKTFLPRLSNKYKAKKSPQN